MTAYPQELLDHLAGPVTSICHCWRLTRKDSAVLGFTDHDQALTVDGTFFEPHSGLSASEARETLGLATDTVDVEGALSSGAVTEDDITAGLFDGARVDVLLVNWAEPSQFVLLRSVSIGRITRRDHGFVAELESAGAGLDCVSGRYVRKTCDAELGDSRCGFALAGPTMAATGTVDIVIGGGSLSVEGLEAFDAGWFSFGVVTWTSGVNSGGTARVLHHSVRGADVTLVLWPGKWSTPTPGDGFSIVAGCDKTFATCKSKFGNGGNFRGFPHLPGNDTGYAYVTDGGVFDGGAVVP